MSYTINLSTGEVTRDADGVIVAPAQSVDEPDYVDYIAWVAGGNQPTITSHPVVESRVVTWAAWRARFTTDEKVAIELASIDDASAALATRQSAARIRVLLADFKAAGQVDLASDAAQDAAALFVSVGALTQDRADLVLNTELSAEEAAI